MKTLKLEVGKTYLSREGKEVRIVGKDSARHPYKGSDGEWYAENGRFNIYDRETSLDLIEEVPSETTRHTFAIPDGVKKVTVEQVGNRIVVEMGPEIKGPKPGDVMVNTYGSVYIFKEVTNYNTHNYYARLRKDGRLAIEWVCEPGHPATPEEAKPLWDALKKAGKRWNAEAMKVEDVPEIDRIREWLRVFCAEEGEVYSTLEDLAEVIGHYLKHREGEK